MSIIEYVTQKAREIPYEQGKKRVYAVVVDKKGNIIAEGQNSYTKTHPLQAMYAERVDLPDKVFLHAEVSALAKVKRQAPYKIYIARVDYGGNPMIASPCPICCEAIKQAGIKLVEYTV